MAQTTVLITGIGGPTPRSIARALKQYGRLGPYRIVGTDCNHLVLGLYERDWVDVPRVVPRCDEDEYWDTLAAIVEQEGVDVAVVQGEVEVEAWALCQTRTNLPCPAMLPTHSLVRVFRDKWEMTRLLAGTRLAPATVQVTRLQPNAEGIARELGLPFWVRASIGTSGIGALRIDAPETLAAWLQVNSETEALIASEYLPGRNLACACLYWQGNLLRAACAERVSYIMERIAPSGVTGNTSFGRLLNDPNVVEVATRGLAHIAAKLGAALHGVFTVDLKEDHRGIPRITEVNVRHVAFTCAFAAGGANLAEDTVQCALGRPERVGGRGAYVFPDDFIFLRDVDGLPIIMPEASLMAPADVGCHNGKASRSALINGVMRPPHKHG